MTNLPPTDLFAKLCTETQWRTHRDYYEIVERQAEHDIRRASEDNIRFGKQAHEAIRKEFDVRCATEASQLRAEHVLLSAQAVAVDGTHIYYPLLSGGRAQIAVATVSYAHQRASAVVYLSEYDFATSSDELIDSLRRRRPGSLVLSQLAIRALMRYKEIDLAMERREPWLMLNGDFFPYELRSGAGSLRVVRRTTELLRRVVDRQTVVSVVARSKRWDILSLGLGLSSGEYFTYGTLETDLQQFLEGSYDLGIAPANLRGSERRAFVEFMNEVAPSVSVGLLKVGQRSYLFQAPTKRLDEAANLVIRDGLFQPIRGYPMLIDYADAVLHRLAPGSEFSRIVEFKLQKHGSLLPEQDEHDLRRR